MARFNNSLPSLDSKKTQQFLILGESWLLRASSSTEMRRCTVVRQDSSCKLIFS